MASPRHLRIIGVDEVITMKHPRGRVCKRLCWFAAIVIFALVALWLIVVCLGHLDPKGSYATWARVASTVILGIVAVFHEKIRAWLYGASLRIEIGNAQPYLVQTCDGDKKKLWIRLGVVNDGGSSAREVEVTVEHLSRIQAEGKQELELVLPANATWAYGHAIETAGRILPAIPSGGVRYCDILNMTHDNGCQVQFASLSLAPLLPANMPGLSPGSYEFDLAVQAADAPTVRTSICVTISSDGSAAVEFSKNYALVANSSKSKRLAPL